MYPLLKVQLDNSKSHEDKVRFWKVTNKELDNDNNTRDHTMGIHHRKGDICDADLPLKLHKLESSISLIED